MSGRLVYDFWTEILIADVELDDDNMVRVSQHALIDSTQGYEINVLGTPTFCLSLFSLYELNSTRYTGMLHCCKCCVSSSQSPNTIIAHLINVLCFTFPTASAHAASTMAGLPNTPPITVPNMTLSTDSGIFPRQTLSTPGTPTISQST